MRTNLAVVLVAIMVLAATASATNVAGDRELSIFGTYINGNVAEASGSTDGIGGGIGYGYFTSDTTEWGLHAWGAWDNPVDLYAAGVNMKYHLCPQNTMDPYVGGQVSYAHSDNSNSQDGVLWGPLAGLKFCMGGNTHLFVEYQYHFFEGSVRTAFDEANAVMAGVAWKF